MRLIVALLLALLLPPSADAAGARRRIAASHERSRAEVEGARGLLRRARERKGADRSWRRLAVRARAQARRVAPRTGESSDEQLARATLRFEAIQIEDAATDLLGDAARVGPSRKVGAAGEAVRGVERAVVRLREISPGPADDHARFQAAVSRALLATDLAPEDLAALTPRRRADLARYQARLHRASLAGAIAHARAALPGQGSRVRQLIDEIEVARDRPLPRGVAARAELRAAIERDRRSAGRTIGALRSALRARARADRPRAARLIAGLSAAHAAGDAREFDRLLAEYGERYGGYAGPLLGRSSGGRPVATYLPGDLERSYAALDAHRLALIARYGELASR